MTVTNSDIALYKAKVSPTTDYCSYLWNQATAQKQISLQNGHRLFTHTQTPIPDSMRRVSFPHLSFCCNNHILSLELTVLISPLLMHSSSDFCFHHSCCIHPRRPILLTTLSYNVSRLKIFILTDFRSSKNVIVTTHFFRFSMKRYKKILFQT